jgi:DNA repair protein RadC
MFTLKASIPARRRPKGKRINGAQEVIKYCAEISELNQEVFLCVTLNIKNYVLDIHLVGVGTCSGCLVTPADIARRAIDDGAAGVILVHNHPGGDPTPSKQDRLVTLRATAALGLLGISVVDHVIITSTGYHSFRDAGDAMLEVTGDQLLDRLVLISSTESGLAAEEGGLYNRPAH